MNILANAKDGSFNYEHEPWVYVYVVSRPLVANLGSIVEADKYGYLTVYEED